MPATEPSADWVDVSTSSTVSRSASHRRRRTIRAPHILRRRLARVIAGGGC